MNDFLILVFVGVLCVIAGLSLRRKAGHYEFPFLASTVFAGFVLIQVIGLRNDPVVSTDALARVIVMSVLCVIACYVGFRAGAKRMPFLNWTYNENRLLLASLVLVVVGAFFWVLISRLPKELTAVTQWSGRPVAYRFLAQCFGYGWAIALVLFLTRRSKAALIPIAIAIFLYADLIVLGVKRSSAAEFLMIILLSVWYVRRRCVPKRVFVIFVIIGTMLVYSIGDIRSIIIGDKVYTSTLKGDFLPSVGEFKKLAPLERVGAALENGAPEVRNAAMLMAAVAEQLSYDYGLNDWNVMVFSLVPAQLVGKTLKQQLMIEINTPLAAKASGGYEAPNGSTFTGVCDAFASFWYFGFIKFLIIGWVLGTLNNSALRGNLGAAILYMTLIVVALEAITHSTPLFFARAVHACVFALPALLFARNGYAVPRTTVAGVPAELPQQRRRPRMVHFRPANGNSGLKSVIPQAPWHRFPGDFRRPVPSDVARGFRQPASPGPGP